MLQWCLLPWKTTGYFVYMSIYQEKGGHIVAVTLQSPHACQLNNTHMREQTPSNENVGWIWLSMAYALSFSHSNSNAKPIINNGLHVLFSPRILLSSLPTRLLFMRYTVGLISLLPLSLRRSFLEGTCPSLPAHLSNCP